jgi:hypothetical protein
LTAADRGARGWLVVSKALHVTVWTKILSRRAEEVAVDT